MKKALLFCSLVLVPVYCYAQNGKLANEYCKERLIELLANDGVLLKSKKDVKEKDQEYDNKLKKALLKEFKPPKYCSKKSFMKLMKT